MPLNPTNQNKVGILLPNPTAPKFDTAFAAGNRSQQAVFSLDYSGPGTLDPAFAPETNISYIGSFKVPYTSDGSESLSTRGANAFCLNETKTGFFMGKDRAIAEWTMPTPSTSQDHHDLPAATRVQSFFPVFANVPNVTNTFPSPRLGWLKIVNGKLFGSITSDVDGTYTLYAIDMSDAQPQLEAFTVTVGEAAGATAPVITVSGSATTTVPFGGTLPTFTASTNDGSPAVVSGDTPVNNVAGTYVIRFNSSNEFGEAQEVTRTVIVNAEVVVGPITSNVFNDVLYNFLGSLGYTGTLNDRLQKAGGLMKMLMDMQE